MALFALATSLVHSGAQAEEQGSPTATAALVTSAALAANDVDQAPAEDADAEGTDITVTGTRRALDVSAAKLNDVPGTTALIDASEVERGRAANLEDTLAFQPGIFAQATTGSTGNKISIRGSGAGTFYGGNSLGMKYLVDGVTISGVAGLHEDRLNTTGYQATEVLYGANAFNYAATSLGGAINFITHTGQSSPGLKLHYEGGSFGTHAWQLSNGGTFGNGQGDYYVAVGRYVREGFQANTKTWRNDAVANIGYRFSDNFDARLLVRWDQGVVHSNGRLTLAQIRTYPTINPNDGGQRQADNTKMVGIKLNYAFDDRSRLEYNISYNDYPLFVGRATLNPSLWRYTDINQTLRYLRNDTLFGRPSNTTIALSDVRLVTGDARYYTHSAPTNDDNQANWVYRQRSQYNGSRDSVLAVGNESELLDRAWLSSGFSVISVHREVRISDRLVPNPSLRDDIGYTATYFAPRVGARFELGSNLNLFTNFSRLIDPPVVWQYQRGTPASNTGTVAPVKSQRANSLEVGIKGSSGPFEGSLTLYKSWISNELLVVVIQPATTTTPEVTAVSNASPTVHQGIEAGLTTRLLGHDSKSGVTFRQAFTVNDFHYKNDATYGGNELPAMPRWVYQGELQYQHPLGFYANVNFRASSSYFVDFANTLKTPAYGIWGLKLGYNAPDDCWSAFVDVRNVTDRKYVTVAFQSYNLRGADSAVFYPGDGVGAFGGVSLRF